MKIHIGFSGDGARKIAKRLRAILIQVLPTGLEVFVDEPAIPGGADWWQTIMASASESEYGIFLLTYDATLQPGWIVAEAIPLVLRKKPAVTLTFPPVVFEDMPPQLKRFQARQFSVESMLRVVRELAELLGCDVDFAAEEYKMRHATLESEVASFLQAEEARRLDAKMEEDELRDVSKRISALLSLRTKRLKKVSDELARKHESLSKKHASIAKQNSELERTKKSIQQEMAALREAKALIERKQEQMEKLNKDLEFVIEQLRKRESEFDEFMRNVSGHGLTLLEHFRDHCRLQARSNIAQSIWSSQAVGLGDELVKLLSAFAKKKPELLPNKVVALKEILNELRHPTGRLFEFLDR